LSGNLENDLKMIASICQGLLKGDIIDFHSVLDSISLYNEMLKIWIFHEVKKDV